MSNYNDYFNKSGINAGDREKHLQIWKTAVEKYANGKRITKKEIGECTQYGLDALDKTKMAVMEWADDILFQFSEECAISIFNLELSELNDDEY